MFRGRLNAVGAVPTMLPVPFVCYLYDGGQALLKLQLDGTDVVVGTWFAGGG